MPHTRNNIRIEFDDAMHGGVQQATEQQARTGAAKTFTALFDHVSEARPEVLGWKLCLHERGVLLDPGLPATLGEVQERETSPRPRP